MKRFLLSVTFICLSFSSFAQATFNGTIDSDWNKPANWSTSLVPNFDTDVIIPGNLSVAINSNVSVKSITVTGTGSGDIDNIILDSNLNLSNASNLGQFRWLSGTISGGATILTGTKSTFASSSNKYLTGGTNLTLNVTYCLGTGTFYLSDSVLNVLELNFTENFSIEGSGTSVLTTTNWITKSGANTTGSINCRLVSNGVVGVNAGVLNINSPDAHFTPHPVSLQTFYSSSTGTLNLNGNLTFAGTFPINNSSPINISGTINIPDTATLNQYGVGMAGLNWTSGTLTGGGTLNNNYNLTLTGSAQKYIVANTTLNNTGNIAAKDSGNLTLSSGSLTNTGTINVEGSGYIYLTDSHLDNLTDGIINLMSDTGISYSQSATDLFNNEGTIVRSTSSGTAKIKCRFHNSGAINVTSGTLETSGICEFNGGTYSVANGAVMNCNEEKTFSGSLSGELNGPMNLIFNYYVPDSAEFNFTGTAGLHWLTGYLLGGGTLTNIGTMNISGDSERYISQNTTLANSGAINMLTNAGLYLTNSTLYNLAEGVINFTSNGTIGLIGSATDSFLNDGTINRMTGTGTAHINCRMTNTGTISVTSGKLDFSSSGNYAFNGGIYNVSDGSEINLLVQGTFSGTLTGTLNGPMNIWTNFDVTTSATNALGGTAGLHWKNGFTGGGGTINNVTVLHLSGNYSRYLIENTTLSNSGVVDMTEGNLYVSGSIINTATGIIDLAADNVLIGANSSAFSVMNNSGLVKKSTGNGTSGINLTLNNDGIVDVQSGTLNMGTGSGKLNNNTTGTVMGTGTIQLPTVANFTNSGTFAPGGNPGTLTAVGSYKSTSDSKLAVELYGLVPGSQYDRLAISGNAIMDGTVDVTLGFAPSINDEFVVATTTGTITSFSMQPATSAEFNGVTYGFSVFERNNNEVVLKVLTLGTVSPLATGISLSPNPANEMLWLENTSGLELSRAEICDLNGRMIGRISLENGAAGQMIPLERLQSGVYFIRILSGNSSVVKKIIKQ